MLCGFLNRFTAPEGRHEAPHVQLSPGLAVVAIFFQFQHSAGAPASYLNEVHRLSVIRSMAAPISAPAKKKRSVLGVSIGIPTSIVPAMRHAPAINARRFLPASGMSPSMPKLLTRADSPANISNSIGPATAQRMRRQVLTNSGVIAFM